MGQFFMKKATSPLLPQITRRKDDHQWYTVGKTQFIPLTSLLLLVIGLILSACAQKTQAPASTLYQSNDPGIYILTVSYMTREFVITKLDTKTHQPLWHMQPGPSDA